MPATTYTCEYDDCEWETKTDTLDQYITLLKLHVDARHRQHAASSKAEKTRRPELSSETSDEDWSYFTSRWTQYKKATGLTGEDIVTQLLECCNEQLRRDHHRTFGTTETNDEKDVLAQLKQIAVTKRNIAVNRVKLGTLKQDRGEPVRKFAGRVKSLAAVSGYTVKCTKEDCNTLVSVMELVVTDQLIRGLADSEIQKDVLSHTDSDTRDLETLLTYIEGKESGRASHNLLSGGGIAAAAQQGQGQQGQSQGKCRWCGEKHAKGKEYCKAVGQTCSSCGKLGHFSKVCRSSNKPSMPAKTQSAAATTESTSDSFSDNCALFIRKQNKDFMYSGVFIEKEANKIKSTKNTCLKELPARDCISKEAKTSDKHRKTSKKLLAQDCETKDGEKDKIKERTDPLPACNYYDKTLESVMAIMVVSAIAATTVTSDVLHHHVYDSSTQSWHQRPAKRKPLVRVQVKVDKTRSTAQDLGIRQLNIQTQEVTDRALADSGASVTLAGLKFMRSMGVSEADLVRCAMRLYGADGADINLIGAVPVIITDTATGRQTRQVLYICHNASSLLLSLEACEDLGYINKNFTTHEHVQLTSNAATRTGKKPDCDCECPVRETAPDAPTVLPLEPTPDNVLKLEQWIRDHYAASAFNTCECQPLPTMHGPPVKIHLQEGAKPVASHSPIPIPLHWHKEVKAGLDRDEAIGVIEKVPSGTPTTWVHKMVCVPKKDNTPRRTVNFVPLNQYSSRETHHTMSPFHQASLVPANTYKTVLDAWNGYHSVALDKESRHLTTFLSPFGRYRYRTLPQGYLAAGDAYTERYDRIIAEVEDKTKCVDDALLWKPSIEEQFFHTCRYLSLCSKNGIVFNKKKFVFCRKEVEFAGFVIANDEVRPSQKILGSITDFPVPKTISDIRGWFGLVNQVAPFFANRRVMEPFRELLKPPAQGKKVYWDDNLTKLFEESKLIIVDAIKQGIKTFKVGEWTCLMTDFCKTGLGFILTQKRCSCTEINPYCCSGGWQVVLTGSRFTKDAEKNYSPVEGETLGIVWALGATRHYTLGNQKLIVATDHKPLLKILGDRKLEDIVNPRLVNLKEKTLHWRFKVIHVPGKIHVGPDTLSRKEVSQARLAMFSDNKETVAMASSDEDNIDLVIEAQVAANIPAPVTWMQIRDEVSKDKIMSMLSNQISEGFPPDKKLLRLELREFFQHRDHLSQVDGVPLYKDRVIIPSALRPLVLETLHSAHQGVTGMTLRAQASVWWPGITPQIRETRDKCRVCQECAPSQPSAPPEPLQCPDYPFQQLASDYFQLGGHIYLVIVDRFSGWPAVQFCGASTGSSRQLKEWLRQFFATYGIPEEIATDGGLTYTSYEIQQFLTDYGIKHRLSSVAFAQSNKRAELGVKSMKRLIRENTNKDGSLTNDNFLRALMTYRNTPDRDTNKSPAQVIFGRNLRDFLPSPQTRYQPQPEWIMVREDREKALAKRAVSNMEKLDKNCRVLPKLALGDSVLVQNQVGNHPSKWDITGVVVEVKEHDQYVVKVDGSGRMTLRNRKFLRKIVPYSMTKHVKDSDNPLKLPEPMPMPRAPPMPPTPPMPEPNLVPEPPLRPPPAPTAEPPLTTPSTAAEPPTQRSEPAPAATPTPDTDPGPRRSSRASKTTDKLQLSWGTKTYAQAVLATDLGSVSLRDGLHHRDPREGGGLL